MRTFTEGCGYENETLRGVVMRTLMRDVVMTTLTEGVAMRALTDNH